MYSLLSHLFPVSIHYLKCIHCLLHQIKEIYHALRLRSQLSLFTCIFVHQQPQWVSRAVFEVIYSLQLFVKLCLKTRKNVWKCWKKYLDQPPSVCSTQTVQITQHYSKLSLLNPILNMGPIQLVFNSNVPLAIHPQNNKTWLTLSSSLGLIICQAKSLGFSKVRLG